MPHKAFGIEWPIYQQKTDPGKPQTALGNEAHYWTPFGYAVALVDIVLLRSEEAGAAFNEAVKAWDLPGCQSLMADTERAVSGYAPDLKRFCEKIFSETSKGRFTPPGKLQTYVDNSEYLSLDKQVRDFIRMGFNRQEDRDNNRCKVTAERAPILRGYVTARTLLEHCKIKLENWNRYRPDSNDRLMKGGPGPRPERLKKTTIIRIYKSLGCQLRHDHKLLQDADHWYQSRVVYSGPEEYCRENYKKNDIFVDPRNVGKFIRPYDSVTNYPKRG